MQRDSNPSGKAQDHQSSGMASANHATPTPEKTRVWEAVGVSRNDTNGGGAISFKIITYNILAQTLLESDTYLFKRCDPLLRDWDTRSKVLLKQMLDESADILCFQEVESKHFNAINERLENGGYSGVFKKKTGISLIDGCATYVKKGVFQIEEVTNVEFYQPNVSVLDHHHVGLIVKVRATRIGKSLVIANTHLFCNPKNTVIRLAQLRLFLAEIDRVSYQFDGRNSGHLPIILAGDLNSRPDSSIIQLLEEGQIRKYNDWINNDWKNIGVTDSCQHLAVYVNRIQGLSTNFDELEINNFEYCKRSSLRGGRVSSAANKLHSAMYINMFISDVLSHSLHFQSVYDTSKTRNKLNFQEFCHDIEDGMSVPRTDVDYIYFNARSGLRPLKRLRLATYGQLPNEFNGSDHQPLVAIFELNAERPY